MRPKDSRQALLHCQGLYLYLFILGDVVRIAEQVEEHELGLIVLDTKAPPLLVELVIYAVFHIVIGIVLGGSIHSCSARIDREDEGEQSHQQCHF